MAARRQKRSVYVILLLACWFGSRVFPASSLASFSSISGLDLFRFFVAWLTAGLMLESVLDASRSRIALPLFLAVTLLLRALLANLDLAELIGGAGAAVVWSVILWRLSYRAHILAGLSVILVALLALSPFHFSAIPRDFSWIPFRSFLESPSGSAIRVFFEKVFLYGGMVWLMVCAGLSMGAAAASGTLLVLGLRFLQVYLPGRSAEITDAILLLMLSAMMKLISLANSPPVSSLSNRLRVR